TAQLLCAPVQVAGATTTTTPASTTTSTTGTPPTCCDSSYVNLCTMPSSGCSGTMSAGPAGSVCDAVTGSCLPSASPGPCCDTPSSGCFAGPEVLSKCTVPIGQGGFGGQLISNGICMGNGQCQVVSTTSTT